MKTKLTLALAAALTGTAFAAFQAPLPEFKNEKQLAAWRAEKAAEPASQKYAADPSAFYTGKPYVASSGAYAFKYRSYNPELARWTSEDPSGFPDGANGNVYAPIPTIGLDIGGLYAIIVATQVWRTDGTWYYDVRLNNGQHPGQVTFTANTDTNTSSSTIGDSPKPE